MYPKLPREVFCPRTKGYREIIYRFENQNLEQNALPDTSWHLNVANFKQKQLLSAGGEEGDVATGIIH